MSIKYMAMVWEDGPENSTDRFVLLALANYANDRGECWPSITTIAEKCSLARRTVLRSIKRLEDDEYITTINDPGKSNRYKITSDKMTPTSDKMTPTSDKMTPTSDRKSPPLVTESHQTSDRESPNPLINHHVKPSVNHQEPPREPEPGFTAMQVLLETKTGIPANNSDLEMIRKFLSIGVIEDDVISALAWRIDNNVGPIMRLGQLKKGIETSRNKRIQAASASNNGRHQNPNNLGRAMTPEEKAARKREHERQAAEWEAGRRAEGKTV